MDQILYRTNANCFHKSMPSYAGRHLVFARMLGFFRFAPIFNRKEIPALVKIPLALILNAIFILPFLSPEKVLTHM